MDANTVRTYEIPIHISPHTLENYPEFAFPPGFTPSQQFPYNVSSASSQVSFFIIFYVLSNIITERKVC